MSTIHATNTNTLSSIRLIALFTKCLQGALNRLMSAKAVYPLLADSLSTILS